MVLADDVVVGDQENDIEIRGLIDAWPDRSIPALTRTASQSTRRFVCSIALRCWPQDFP